MAQTLVRKVMLQIDADDGDTEAKLDRITAKADELKALHPELTVKIDSAAASAKLGVLRQELKDVGKPVKADVKVDDGDSLAKALTKTKALGQELDQLAEKGGSGSGGSSGGGLLSKILFGSEGEGGGGGLSGIPVLGPLIESPGLLAALIPVVGGLATEGVALATGLTAAGLGVGSFAALAMPAFTKVTGAYSQLKTDQLAYDDALTKSAKNTALHKLQDDLKGLDPAERAALKGLQSLTGEYGRVSKAFEPTAFKVMNEGLGIASRLLPYVERFAYAAAPAIEGLLGSLSSGLKSQQFGYFMSFLEGLEGPVLTAVGSGMKGLTGDVMTLMEQLSKKDVINSINIAFRVLGYGITLLAGIVVGSMKAWDFLTQTALPAVRLGFDLTRHAIATAGHDIDQTFDTVRHGIATDGHDIAVSFDDVRHSAATLAHDTAAHFDESRHDVAQWSDDVRHDVDDVISFFERLPHEIEQQTDKFDSLLVSAGENLIDGLIHGIDSKVDSLKHDVFHLGSDVVGWAEDAFGIHSPSTKFASIGDNIDLGLSLGIKRTSASVLSEMNTLLKSIVDATASGEITRSQSDQLGLKLSAALAAALKQSIGQALGPALTKELTTTGKITKASLAALAQIWDAQKGGLIDTPQASALAKWVKADNVRLQALSTERAKIANEITTVKAYASSTASATEGTYNLASAVGTGANPAGVGSIIFSLRTDVTKIRKFGMDVKKLARDGLNKSYLQQLIAMGPDAGGALAAELVASGMGDIRQINSAESAITSASNQLGGTAVSAMYTGGKEGGNAFVKQLQSQQAAINEVMAAAARHEVAVLRKELGAGGGAAQKVEIRLVGGDKAFRVWLKKMIRVTGGDVTVVGA